MPAAKRDVSGVFEAELENSQPRKAVALDSKFHLSHNGITFVSETCLPEWTEVGVQMRMPIKGARKDHSISCRGVVVQCARRQEGKGFEVSLLFLDLSKRAQAQLDAPPAAMNAFRILIAR